MKLIIAILLGICVFAGVAYVALNNKDGYVHQEELNNRDTNESVDTTELKTFVSEEFGFQLQYPASYGDVHLMEVVRGQIYITNNELIEAPNLPEYNYYLYTDDVAGDIRFSVVGEQFMLPRDGFPVDRMLADCKANAGDGTCVARESANGTEYYFIENFQFLVGEWSVALMPVRHGAIFVATVTRTDSSELPSTQAEYADFLTMIDSLKKN